MTVLVEISFNNGALYEEVFSGLYDFSENEETNLRKIKSAIIRSDFWTKFINRQETPVDIQRAVGVDGDSVDVITPVDLPLLPQPVQAILHRKQKKGFNTGAIYPDDFSSPDFQPDIPSGGFAQLNLDDEVLAELEKNYNIPFAAVSNLTDIAAYMSPEYPSELEFDIKFSIAVFRVNFVPGFDNDDDVIYTDLSGVDFTYEAKVWIKIGDDVPIEFTRSDFALSFEPFPGAGYNQINNWSTFTYTGTTGLLDAGTPIRIYFENTGSAPFGYRYNTIEVLVQQPIILGDESNAFEMQPIIETYFPGLYITGPTKTLRKDFGVPEGEGVESYIKITGKTIYPQTTSPAFFIHDVARSIIDRITSQNNSFTSEYIGNQDTSPSYPSQGCGSNYVNIKGLHLRGYSLSEKQFFLSFKDFWQGVNPILNLGLGYTNAQNKIEIEEQSAFYDPTISVYFDNVLDIVRRYDNDVIFNKIDIGYTKWQSENISGLDDAQTKKSYATRFKKVGKAISLMSGFIAASYAIETTRRATKEKSADYKFDDETFIISIDGLPGDVYPETDQYFLSITNLKYAEDRYNSRITPARNFLRWIKYFNGCLQKYIGSVYKFVSGEGNYDMTSELYLPDCEYDLQEPADGVVSEKEDLYVEDNFLHLPDLFEINLTMNWGQYKAIKTNRKKAIGISQTGTGHVPFFIKTLEYEVCRSKARIVAWPKTEFSIQQVDFVQPSEYCAPIPPDSGCGDLSRTTEDGDVRLTEDGSCREIE
jgi:hypothetical protein